MTKRIILAARYYSIEPLGILYLAGVVRDCGWECEIVLVREFDFEPLYEAVRRTAPDMVGFQIWTGWHLEAFCACDVVRAMGTSVVIGGPHATYFDAECAKHADWVIKGGGFGMLAKLLSGNLPGGVHFNTDGREDAFPLPNRDALYQAYPEFGESPIKSIFGSVGCPMRCTYCYAPAFNKMHGGFKLLARPIDELVAEARDLMRYPTKLVYFQDDIFGYPPKWVEEFSRRWKREVGLPFHCQIRLELTRGDAGNKRLDAFAEAGCTGITLAIESGNAFLRDHVLFRHMPDELIVDGCRKIMDRGMTLRTEQILAVPFSSVDTDLVTLDLNNRINPTMAWTSILAPYAGTDMGTIAEKFGFYGGNNDDLAESFFDRSVLRHVAGGPSDMSRIVAGLGEKASEGVLLRMNVQRRGLGADVFYDTEPVGSITYLSDEENARYGESTVRLQRLFNVLARIPRAQELGRRLINVPQKDWSWARIGGETKRHLLSMMSLERLNGWQHRLSAEYRLPRPEPLPEALQVNPWFFCFFPAGGVLARKAIDAGLFAPDVPVQDTLDRLGTMARRHLFHFDLYKLETGEDAIAL